MYHKFQREFPTEQYLRKGMAVRSPHQEKRKKSNENYSPFSQPTLKTDKMTTIASYSNPMTPPEVTKYVAYPMVRVKDDEKTIPFLR
jgi:hypothetical protein